AARELFLREGILHGKWKSDIPYVTHAVRVIARAQEAEAKLRRRGVIRPDDEIMRLLEARLPPTICDPVSLEAWLDTTPAAPPAPPARALADVLRPGASPARDEALYPSVILIDGRRCEVRYALAPGKDDDGVTLTVGLA